MDYTSGMQIRFDWLNNKLEEYLLLCESEDEIIELMYWYFSSGKELGLTAEELKCTLKKLCSQLYDRLDYAAGLLGKTPPDYRLGDGVEVIVNAKNLTYHKGRIIEHIWHSNDRCWNFYISENDKKISKRYLKDDLKSLDKNE